MNKKLKQKIFVTGGNGFFGSNLVKKLLSIGHKVISYDNNFRGSESKFNNSNNNLKIINGDIRDKELITASMRDCDAVFHLAFINGTKYFYENPSLVLDVGVKGSINTIEATIENNIRSYILASSSEIYCEPTKIPTTEKERAIIPDLKNPWYSYSGGKIISELLTLNYFRELEIREIIFRPHNIFGPEMGFEHVIPDLMKKISLNSDNFRNKKSNINIQGTGNETRSFCYIDDAIDQLMLIFEKGLKSGIYNVGIQNEISIKELIFKISNILGIEIDTHASDLRLGGAIRRCPEMSKIRKLGFFEKSNFEYGLKKTIDWYTDYYKNFRN